ncbi:MAG: hypothetical protein ACRDID_04785 [Ktedonobacterales bacterium]
MKWMVPRKNQDVWLAWLVLFWSILAGLDETNLSPSILLPLFVLAFLSTATILLIGSIGDLLRLEIAQGGLLRAGVYLLCVAVNLPLMFGGALGQFYLLFGGFAVPQGAQLRGPSGIWVHFAWSSLSGTLTYGATQTFDWFVIPIRATAWWSRALLVVYSAISDIIVFGTLINLLRAGIARVNKRNPQLR